MKDEQEDKEELKTPVWQGKRQHNLMEKGVNDAYDA